MELGLLTSPGELRVWAGELERKAAADPRMRNSQCIGTIEGDGYHLTLWWSWQDQAGSTFDDDPDLSELKP